MEERIRQEVSRLSSRMEQRPKKEIGDISTQISMQELNPLSISSLDVKIIKNFRTSSLE